MKEKPLLSIVTATKGDFSDYWLEQLLAVSGSIQFILVYPPQVPIRIIEDSRVKVLISPYQGEVMQRFVGLLNVQSQFVLALDDDDFVHPGILECTYCYFQRFPKSWVLRLKIKNIDFLDEAGIKQSWQPIGNLAELTIDCQTPENPFPFQQGKHQGLLEVPIAPLNKSFDIRHAVFPWHRRSDMAGIHFENFNNKVWRNDLVQPALAELSQAMKVAGALTWIPAWSLDRLLGLFIQAKFFQKDAIIGHAMPQPEQIRFSYKNPALKEPRLYLSAEILLMKSYPQYGYLWNLFFWQVYTIPKVIGKGIKKRLIGNREQGTGKRGNREERE